MFCMFLFFVCFILRQKDEIVRRNRTIFGFQSSDLGLYAFDPCAFTRRTCIV